LIKQKIEQDKKEREALKKAAKPDEPPKKGPAEATMTEPAAKKEYTDALIQFRLPDGNSIKANFKPTDPVRTAHSHIAMLLGNSNFSLVTTFPKKVFSPRDSAMDKTTLAQAECVPTGTFVVSKQ